MKRFTVLLVVALALASIGTGSAAAQGMGPVNQVTIELKAQNNSGQTGTARLVGTQDGKTMVTLTLSGGGADAQPAHIHKGTCANLDPTPAFPLTSVRAGTSETTVDVTLETLLNDRYAINVHKSAAEAQVYVACGEIVNMQLGPGGGGAQTPPGTAQQDPLSVANALITALKNGDTEAAMALFADDATVTIKTGRVFGEPDEVYTTREDIQREFVETAPPDLEVVGTPQVSGNMVSIVVRTQVTEDEGLALGLTHLDFMIELTVVNGKVQMATLSFTPETEAALLAALGQPGGVPIGMPRTGFGDQNGLLLALALLALTLTGTGLRMRLAHRRV